MRIVNIIIDKKRVECKIRKVKNPLGDIILLTGATTFSGTYIFFRKYFKYYNLIIINTPAHGKSTGKAIKEAEQYLEFYEKTISALIKGGYCGSKINLLGYSLGGMTLYHLVNRESLKHYIDKSILLFSAYKTDPENLESILKRLDTDSNKSLKSLVLNNFNPIAPVPLNILPRSIFFANRVAAFNDFILCKSFNELSEINKYQSNGSVAKGKYAIDFNGDISRTKEINKVLIIATDDAFFHTEEIKITKSNLAAQFIPIYNKSHFSPIWRPKSYVRHIEEFLMDNY